MQSEGNYYWWAPDVAKVEAARFEVVRDEGEMGEKRNWNWVRAKTCELVVFLVFSKARPYIHVKCLCRRE